MAVPLSAKIAATAVTPTMRDGFVAKAKRLAYTGAKASREAYAQWIAGDVDRLTTQLVDMTAQRSGLSHQLDESTDALASARTEISSLSGTVADLQAKLKDLVTNAWPDPGAPALGSKVFTVPAGVPSVEVKPGGIQTAINAAAPGPVTLVAIGGTYKDQFSVPRGKSVTIQPKSSPALGVSDVVWFDGGGTVARQATASSKLLFRGIGTRNHAPAYEPDPQKGDSNNAAFYFGGETPGSGFEDCIIGQTTGNGFSSMVPIVLRRCTIEDIGHTGFMATRANGSIVEDVLIRRFNTKGRPAEPESAAAKITRTKGMTLRNVRIEDGNGAHGLWLDVSCTDVTFVHIVGKGAGVAGRKALVNVLNLELSERILLVDVQASGATDAGVMVNDTGHVRFWGCDLRGNFVGAWLKKSPRYNTGAEGDPKDVPWITAGIEFHNTRFDGPNQIWAYDDTKQYDGASWIEIIEGCDFGLRQPTGIMWRFGQKAGGKELYPATLDQLASVLGATKVRSNYQGTDHAAAAKTRVTPPAAVQELLTA
jgi:hypothetical protein